MGGSGLNSSQSNASKVANMANKRLPGVGTAASSTQRTARQNTISLCPTEAFFVLLGIMSIFNACNNRLLTAVPAIYFVKAPVDVARVAAVLYPPNGTPWRDSVQLSFASRYQVLVQRRRRRGSPVLEPDSCQQLTRSMVHLNYKSSRLP